METSTSCPLGAGRVSKCPVTQDSIVVGSDSESEFARSSVSDGAGGTSRSRFNSNASFSLVKGKNKKAIRKAIKKTKLSNQVSVNDMDVDVAQATSPNAPIATSRLKDRPPPPHWWRPIDSPLVHRMSRRNGKPLWMVFAILPRIEETRRIFSSLNNVCGLLGIRVEAPHRKGGSGQCHRCQKYGHASANCYTDPRCVMVMSGPSLDQKVSAHPGYPRESSGRVRPAFDFDPGLAIDLDSALDFDPNPAIDFDSALVSDPSPAIDLDQTLDFDPSSTIDLDQALDFDPSPVIDLDQALDFDPSPALDFDPSPVIDLDQTLDFDPSSAIDLDQALDFDPSPAIDLDQTLNFDPSSTIDLDQALDFNPSPVIDLDQALNFDPSPAIDLSQALDSDSSPVTDLDQALDSDPSPAIDLDQALDSNPSLAINLDHALDFHPSPILRSVLIAVSLSITFPALYSIPIKLSRKMTYIFARNTAATLYYYQSENSYIFFIIRIL
ncbi:hypothetical protein EVAR_52003_1 [Eumeta japonica]|uniref:Uncharacterized protein n=1 Tax=Eumeta variegata TaxID=151549 RepID=A0A4C1Y0N6_EUMVA|nr:hypothetical protein EVAR_52003_1 [Eumeta japonica]